MTTIELVDLEMEHVAWVTVPNYPVDDPPDLVSWDGRMFVPWQHVGEGVDPAVTSHIWAEVVVVHAVERPAAAGDVVRAMVAIDKGVRSGEINLGIPLKYLYPGEEPTKQVVLPDAVIADLTRAVATIPAVTVPAWRQIEPAPIPPDAMPVVDRTAVTTLHGTPVEAVREQHAAQPTGQHADYIVLTDAERAKGHVRPVRDAYVHVGPRGPQHPLRDLTEEERARFAQYSYIKYEAYQPSDAVVNGRYWTQAQLDAKGCGRVTTMGRKLAETYARDPGFYGSTFCVGCNRHLPVGAEGEFVWHGTSIRVGT
jgi:hypothetical protein